MRVGEPDRLAKTDDILVLDDEAHAGVAVGALRMLSGAGLALLLVQDVGGRIYALRIDGSRSPAVVRVSR